MKLLVANRDVTESLGVAVSKAAAERAKHASPRFHVPEVSALSLVNCKSEEEYFSRFIRLLLKRHGASTDDFDIQRAPGLMGAIMKKIKRFLWKLLVYQHDRMIFQQNLINEMIIHAIEFEMSERNKEIEKLRTELKQLVEQKKTTD